MAGALAHHRPRTIVSDVAIALMLAHGLAGHSAAADSVGEERLPGLKHQKYGCTQDR